MKKHYPFLMLFVVFGLSAQESETARIAESEMKSASALTNLVLNPNTWNYDITYHKLEFTVDPDEYYISGTVTTTYTALEDMAAVTFDLSGELLVTSVTQNNVALDFIQNVDDELVIALPATQIAGTSATVEIIYEGEPPSTGFGSFVTSQHQGQPIMWTLSEPFGAREWWPCKQDLNDKVNTIDVYITAPSTYVSVANGLEQSQIDNGDGTTTTWFKHNYPIPAYLIAIAVTNYQVFTQQGGLGTPESPFFPIVNYMYPETAAANQASVAVTPDIINFFESKFGDYPFRDEKYGHAQFHWGGGMEHTTVSFMTAGFNGGYSRELIAHEMAHQWFGDKITCGSWNDIWLNEGFATYLASMVIELQDGDAAFTSDKFSMIQNITSAPFGAVYLTDAEALNVNRIFSNRLSYDKGAMVLNMLRFKLGDTNFFQGMLNYINDPALAYAYATTPDFQAHLEATSGMDLTEFFNDWIYNQGYPSYSVTAKNLGGGQVRFVVNQTTSHPSVPFFEMPVPVRVFGTGGQQLDVVLDNTVNNQTIIQSVPFTVTGIAFDPRKNIIAANNTTALGNEMFDWIDAVQLYPNPSSGILNVSLPNGVNLKSAAFTNILGQTVLQSGGETTWDVSGLATGIHIITLITDAGIKKMKFIKE